MGSWQLLRHQQKRQPNFICNDLSLISSLFSFNHFEFFSIKFCLSCFSSFQTNIRLGLNLYFLSLFSFCSSFFFCYLLSEGSFYFIILLFLLWIFSWRSIIGIGNYTSCIGRLFGSNILCPIYLLFLFISFGSYFGLNSLKILDFFLFLGNFNFLKGLLLFFLLKFCLSFFNLRL